MGLIILLVVGGVIGWLASIVMRTDGQQGLFPQRRRRDRRRGAGGFIVTPLIGGAPITSGELSVQSVLVSLVGAIILLAIINLFRRGAVR